MALIASIVQLYANKNVKEQLKKNINVNEHTHLFIARLQFI